MDQASKVITRFHDHVIADVIYNCRSRATRRSSWLPNDSLQTFPLKIFTSTLPRARQTVEWEECNFRVDELSNLNPLDKGDFAGFELEEIKQMNPAWYEKLEHDPFHTR